VLLQGVAQRNIGSNRVAILSADLFDADKPGVVQFSRTLMPGVFEIANKTCEWFVRKVQVVVASAKVTTHVAETVKFDT
jgi:hypothetical protein